MPKPKKVFPVARKRRELARTHPELNPRLRNGVLAHILARYPRLVITSTTGGQHSPTSHHPHGNAADVAVPFQGLNAREIREAKLYMSRVARWIMNNDRFVSRLNEGIFKGTFNLSVKNGKRQGGASFWGEETWDDHDDHMHFAKT